MGALTGEMLTTGVTDSRPCSSNLLPCHSLTQLRHLQKVHNLPLTLHLRIKHQRSTSRPLHPQPQKQSQEHSQTRNHRYQQVCQLQPGHRLCQDPQPGHRLSQDPHLPSRCPTDKLPGLFTDKSCQVARISHTLRRHALAQHHKTTNRHHLQTFLSSLHSCLLRKHRTASRMGLVLQRKQPQQPQHHQLQTNPPLPASLH